jgi:hypothetical protein
MRETVFEDDIDFGEGHTEAPPTRAGRILSAAERALDEEGIPWALVDGGDAEVALGGAHWILLPTSCGVDPALLDAVTAATAKGARVTFAPSPPRRDGAFRPLSSKRELPRADVLVGDEAVDVGAIRHHLREGRGDVPRVSVEAPCSATLHRDREGAPRVVFLINPTRTRQRIAAEVAGVKRVRDLLDGSTHELSAGVPTDALTVRFCEVLG